MNLGLGKWVGFSENVSNILFSFFFIGTASWTPDLQNLEVKTEMVSELRLGQVGGLL